MAAKKLTLLIALSFIIVEVNAQCCGAGNPIYVTNVDQSISKNNIQFSLDYRHSESDRYYEGSIESDFNFFGMVDKTSYDFMNIGIGYGVTRKITLQTQLGYYIQKSEDFDNPMLPDASISGLGDMSVSLSYCVFRDIKKGIEFTPFASIKIPVGKFDSENAGVKLPLSMQTSSGSFKYSLGFSFYSNLSEKFYLTLYGLYEYSQRIVSTNFDYQYGGLFYSNVAAYYKIHKVVSMGMQMGYEFQGRAKSENCVLIGTSYHMIKAIPQVLCRLSSKWQLMLIAEMPLWRYVEEIQMSNKFVIQSRLVYNINI